jgi:hypothetical protein
MLFVGAVDSAVSSLIVQLQYQQLSVVQMNWFKKVAVAVGTQYFGYVSPTFAVS